MPEPPAGRSYGGDLSDERVVDHDVVPPSLDKHAITSLELMLGDVTLVAGDAAGGVTNWFFVKPASERRRSPRRASGAWSRKSRS